MKKVFLIIILLCSFQSYSQLSFNRIYEKSGKKELTGELGTKTSYVKTYSNNLPVAVIADFFEKYPGVQDVAWFINEKNVTGYFQYKGQDITVSYKKDGFLLSTRKVYDRTRLSARISQYLEDEVGREYEVHMITELVKDDYTIYEVSLLSLQKLCIIQVCRNHDDERLSMVEKKILSNN